MVNHLWHTSSMSAASRSPLPQSPASPPAPSTRCPRCRRFMRRCGLSRSPHLLAAAAGLSRPRIPDLGRLHGPRQLGHRHRRRLALRLHAAVGHHDLESDGHSAAKPLAQAGRGHGARSGAALPPELRPQGELCAVGGRGDRHRRLRSGRSDRLGHRPESALPHSALLRRAHHRPGRAADPFDPALGFPLH